MDFTIAFLPDWLVISSLIVSSLFILLIAIRIDWRKTYESGTLNVWFVTIFALAAMWMLRAEIDSGLNVHVLGTMLFTLMFGWRLGIVGLSLVCVLISLWGNSLAVNLGMAILLNALVGATVCYAVFLIVEKFLPNNFYIYLYVSAFFGAALNYCLIATLSVLLLGMYGAQSWSTLINDYLPFLYLMSFSESFVTCGLLTIFVVYRPEWVFSFRDERYLKGK